MSLPPGINTVPFRAFLVGRTESNMSTPLITASRMSPGAPTPIRYLGLQSGSRSVTTSIISYMVFFSSPTESPPIAYPGKLISTIFFVQYSLRSLYLLPWTIPKSTAGKQSLSHSFFDRPAHSSVMSTASLAASYAAGISVQISRGIMISAPMFFSIRMTSSGVRKCFEPSM